MMRLGHIVVLACLVGWASASLGRLVARTAGVEPQSRRLRNGVLHRVLLGPHHQKTFYFQLREEDSFWLYVTPCGGTVKWRLSIIRQDDQGNATADQPHRAFRAEEVLVQEVGRERMSYSAGEEGLGPGLVRLHFLSPYESSWAELFATKDLRRLYAHFPRLPHLPKDKALALHNLSHSAARLSWAHSPSLDPFRPAPPIQYCLALSPARPFYSFCHLEQALGGLAQPSQKSAKSNRLFEEDSREALAKKKALGAAQPWVACTKSRNTLEVGPLGANLKYHASLFVVNTATGGTAAYDGLSLRTPGWDEGPRQSHWLRDGRLQSAYLNPERDSYHLYLMRLTAFTPRLRLILQPCQGYLRIQLLKDGKLLKKATVSALQRFVVTNLSPGTLELKVTNDDNDAKVFKVWASRHASREPFPRLPEDPSLKAAEGTRTCVGVRLVWLPAKGRLKYCLYRKLEPDDYFKRLILEEDDECKGPERSWELSRCLIHSVKGGHLPYSPLLSTEVSGLEAGRMYRFDLLVAPIGRMSAQTLSYRTLWIKTKPACD